MEYLVIFVIYFLWNSFQEIKMVQVEDIDVKFPYEPYECQMKMMREVIRGLNNVSGMKKFKK